MENSLKRISWSLLVLVALLVSVSCDGAGSAQTSTGDGTQAAADLGHPSLGKEDAPVVMIEYGDYQ